MPVAGPAHESTGIRSLTNSFAMKLKKGEGSKIAIDMTPMIDIVFQLLTFFIMTLKIATPEGDFNIKMPLAAPRAGTPDPDALPPMKLRLVASSTGDCADIILNARSFSGANRWKELHAHVLSIVGDGSQRADAEVEIDADYNLKYENVIEAITAVSGSIGDDGQVVKLVEKIKFAPPKAG
jgi:biopolymer transport protein ExbD